MKNGKIVIAGVVILLIAVLAVFLVQKQKTEQPAVTTGIQSTEKAEAVLQKASDDYVKAIESATTSRGMLIPAEQKDRIEKAAIELFQRQALGVISSATSSDGDVRIVEVSYPKETVCGIYGARLCMYLVQRANEPLVLLNGYAGDGETIDRLLPEGALIHSSFGDGGEGIESYALMDVRSGEKTPIVQRQSEGGPAMDKETITANGKTIQIGNDSYLPKTEGASFTELPIYTKDENGNSLSISGITGTRNFVWFSFALDPELNLRNKDGLYFTLRAPDAKQKDRHFKYDGKTIIELSNAK